MPVGKYKLGKREYMRQYRAANKERLAAYTKAYAEQHHRRRTERMYGLERDGYDSLLTIQKGICAICGGVGKQRLHVDHSHETGKIRGLLCYRCNMLLGYAQDSAAFLRQAADYLEQSI